MLRVPKPLRQTRLDDLNRAAPSTRRRRRRRTSNVGVWQKRRARERHYQVTALFCAPPRFGDAVVHDPDLEPLLPVVLREVLKGAR
jgi:hypothetical protein